VYGHFAKDMIWSTATAAYQVEGGWNADGKTPSIWDLESHVKPSVIAGNATGDVACDSYNLWQTDITNMAAMGVRAMYFEV
jgi:lactase-phlorizin hydrolase